MTLRKVIANVAGAAALAVALCVSTVALAAPAEEDVDKAVQTTIAERSKVYP